MLSERRQQDLNRDATIGNRAGAPQPIPVAANTKSMNTDEHQTNAGVMSQCIMWLDQSPGFRRLGYDMEQARSACEQPKLSFKVSSACEQPFLLYGKAASSNPAARQLD